VKLRMRPSYVREVLEHYEREGWTSAIQTYNLQARTLQRWVLERKALGPAWPSQADEDEWIAAQPRRTYNRRKMTRYRVRSRYGAVKLLIDSTGTRRRVQALQRIGWRAEDIAALGPWNAKDAVYELTKRPRVTRRNAAVVVAIYDQLSMKPGPSEETRRRAIRAGWPSPLAWDDDTIDDPDAQPADAYRPQGVVRNPETRKFEHPDEPVDESVVIRILNGDWKLKCSKAEKFAVVARWAGDLNELERLTGWKVERYIVREEPAA
jgi:hypothetical protein